MESLIYSENKRETTCLQLSNQALSGSKLAWMGISHSHLGSYFEEIAIFQGAKSKSPRCKLAPLIPDTLKSKHVNVYIQPTAKKVPNTEALSRN